MKDAEENSFSPNLDLCFDVRTVILLLFSVVIPSMFSPFLPNPYLTHDQVSELKNEDPPSNLPAEEIFRVIDPEDQSQIQTL